MADALQAQIDALSAAQTYEPQLEAYRANITNPSGRRNAAAAGRNDARDVIRQTTGSFPAGSGGTIAQLTALINEYDNPATTDARRVDILNQYTSIPLYTDPEVTAFQTNWQTLLR